MLEWTLKWADDPMTLKHLTAEACLEILDALRSLSHQIEQKSYMLLSHEDSIDEIANGVQKFHDLHLDYNQKQKDLDSQIETMKSLVDLPQKFD